jgi:PAS domain S-box-containing protein
VDPEWRVTFVNHAAEKATRRTRTEVLGKVLWDEFPEMVGTEFQRQYERAVETGAAVNFEALYPSNRWYEVRAYPSPQGLAISYRNITEMREAREAIRVNEERFRLLAKATNDAIWDWDILTDHNWWNDGLEILFGYRRDEIEPTLGGWRGLIHPDDEPAVTASFHGAIETGKETWSDEYRFLRKDGSYAYVLDRGYIIRDADGRAVRMIGGVTDITQRKLAEARIAEQAALIDQARDAILVRDLDHRVLFWSKGAERLFGWTAEEAKGRPVGELTRPEPETFAEAQEIVLREGAWSGEIEAISKTGQKLTLDNRWTLLRNSRNEPKSILSIGTDITERKKIEQQFLRAQRMESVGTLAGGIAHDLNNVLGPILLSIDLLKTRVTDQASEELLTIIASSAKRGSDMVRQVLSYARGVEGRRAPLKVEHAIREIETFANETFLKHIRVRSIIPRDLWTISADPTQVHQVLLNLCVNARDAMPNGGTLTLSAENVELDAHYAGLNIEAKPGRYVTLQVEDTGVGMPPEIIDRIFDPFFTTKDVGKGTGLGLSTTQGIVASHGGFIRVYSELNRGTKFRVHFPAQTGPGSEPSNQPLPEIPRGNGESILVVDDELSVRQITKATLEAFGYRVILASDGAEAVAIYANRGAEIDAVLTDMMMPGIDGPAAVQVLKKMNPNLRIIASSGLSTEAQVATAEAIGVKHFLPKPYTAEMLLRTLRGLFSGPE